ncbi:MAG: hypothetical protein HFG00_11095 [Oscillibacter sp.]|nr:hypothetical protein [Oscillibacter sp.]
MVSWPWSELGLPGPAGLPEIRRAYAHRLKTAHPEEDPEGFQRLHDAYQTACRLARKAGRTPPPDQAGERFPDWSQAERSPEEETPQESEEPDTWDFERLFAEGEAEEQEARRRKLEELREKNRDRYKAQERDQRRRAADEEEAWAAVMAAAHALELLYTAGAPLAQWQRFFNGPTFWSARANLDFLFALEDFLEQHPDLSQEVRNVIFAAYDFQRGPGKPEYRRLCQLLQVDRAERRRQRRARSKWRAAWRSYPPRRKVATVVGIGLLALMTLISVGSSVYTSYKNITGERRALQRQEQLLAWLAEDFGGTFVHPLEEEEAVFAPADHPDQYFFAYPEGRREEGAAGYQTNYADRMVMASMEDFAEEQGLELGFDSAGGGFQGRVAETPGAYLLQMPLLGAGESITILGERLEDLREQDWYRRMQPDFEVFLCFGDVSFYKVRSTEGDFDGDYARALYETKFPANLCRYIVQLSGTAERDFGEDACVLLEQGTMLLDGDPFFWVTAQEKPPSNVRLGHYFLSEDGASLFCIPEERFSSQLNQETLFQGEPFTAIVSELGLRKYVTVWDQIRRPEKAMDLNVTYGGRIQIPAGREEDS